MDDIKMIFRDEREAKRLFQKLPFYNSFIKKPRIKHLKNIDLLHELPFYDIEIEIIDSKDILAQLEATKLSIKDFFKDLIDKFKGFKYQITVKVLLSKHKGNGGMNQNSDSFLI